MTAMNELIKIQQHNGDSAVSARELHLFLEVDTRFKDWISRMFEYGFDSGKDYEEVLLKNENNSKGGRPSVDYALTLDCAKEIAMLQRTAKGKLARQYFIDVEKKLKAIVKPMSPLEIMEMSIRQLREQDTRVTAIEEKVHEIECKQIVRPDFFTIAGFAALNKFHVGLRTAVRLGSKASAICRKMGIRTDEIPDPRFGRVKSYPRVVLEKVFAENMS